jgi:predicted metal-dependent RNase
MQTLQGDNATRNKIIKNIVKEIMVNRVLKEDGVGVGAIGGAPANNTSGAVATQEPKIYPKSKKKPIFGMARRSSLAIKEIK